MAGKGSSLQTSTWRDHYTRWMTLWAVLAHSWLIIQAVDIYHEKNAEGLSLAAFIFLSVSSIIWFIYGTFVIQPRNTVLTVSSTVSFSMAVVIIIGILLYNDNTQKTSNAFEIQRNPKVGPLS
jgi:uncharacterized protein with PQ loop repeat